MDMNATEWLNDLEAKADAATQGPWKRKNHANTDIVSIPTRFFVLRDGIMDNCNADFIAAANPETVKRLVEMVRELAEAVGDPCYTCAWENAAREEECPKGCHVAMTLKKYGMSIPRNPEMEVFG